MNLRDVYITLGVLLFFFLRKFPSFQPQSYSSLFPQELTNILTFKIIISLVFSVIIYLPIIHLPALGFYIKGVIL